MMRPIAIAGLCLALTACNPKSDNSLAMSADMNAAAADAENDIAAAQGGGVSAAGPIDTDRGSLEAKMEVAAEAAIRAKLRDPDSAKFSDERLSDRGKATVICGRVNAKNGYGGMDGAERFISNGDLAFLESEMAVGQMDGAWDQLC